MEASPHRLWRWPLGWLYVLTLGLDAALAGRLGWIFLHRQQYFGSGTGHLPSWFFLALWLWLLLAGVGLLALVLGLVNAFRRRVGRTLAWLGLSVLAFGSCVAAAFPVILSFGGAPSVGDPPHVDDEQ